MSFKEKMKLVVENTIEIRNIEYLMKLLKWTRKPILDDPSMYEYKYMEDANDRRVRDAEVIASSCQNISEGSVILEIGTSYGYGTALMSLNAPKSRIHTLNLPPDDASLSGKNITHVLSKNDIGCYYRSKKCTNVNQIYADTKSWVPDIKEIDIAYIDGCHDKEFVINDTMKIMKICKPGSIIMWHDFNLELRYTYHWINEVCSGIEHLYKRGILKNRILHLQDSWVGLYIV